MFRLGLGITSTFELRDRGLGDPSTKDSITSKGVRNTVQMVLGELLGFGLKERWAFNFCLTAQGSGLGRADILPTVMRAVSQHKLTEQLKTRYTLILKAWGWSLVCGFSFMVEHWMFRLGLRV